jgi:branched-chain amino acid transport system ATP-binding protein
MPTLSDEGLRASPHLVVTGLTAGYGAVPIISDISITVGLGEVVTVIGPNGAGKSTLLKAMTGQLKPMAGEITLGGRDIGHMPGEKLARLGVGYVPQTRDVFDTLTAQENLEMGGYLLPKKQVAERIEAVFGVFPNLAAMRDRVASHMSGGERKMLAFGRVLMLDPTLLVLDEPTSALSPDLSRVVLHEHVRRLADAGAAVVLVEQRALEALEVSDWGYVLVSGSVRMAGKAAELLARPDIRTVFLGQTADNSNGTGQDVSNVAGVVDQAG